MELSNNKCEQRYAVSAVRQTRSMQVIKIYFIGLFLNSPVSNALEWQCVLLLMWDVPVSELNPGGSLDLCLL